MHFTQVLTKSIQHMVEKHRTMMNSDNNIGRKADSAFGMCPLQGVGGKHLSGASTLIYFA